MSQPGSTQLARSSVILSYYQEGIGSLEETGAPLLFSNGSESQIGVVDGSSLPYSINDSGVIVGTDQLTAALFSGGQVTPLQSLIQYTPQDLLVAYSINNSGEIVGWAADQSNIIQPFMLTPYTGSGILTMTNPGDLVASMRQSTSAALGSFTQFATTGPYSVDVNWGDGSTDTKFTETAAGDLGSQTHTYSKTGTDTVTVKVTDAAGTASTSGTFPMAISAASLANLAVFNGTIDDGGQTPFTGLVRDSAGNLYGTTSTDGTYQSGTVFKIAEGTNKLTTLVDLNGTVDDGGETPNSLIIDSAGNLYGTTSTDANFGGGTVFKIAAGTANLKTLALFNGTVDEGGSDPVGLAIDKAGNLYGTTATDATYSGGTVFKITAGTGKLTTLAVFNGKVDSAGTSPTGSLVLDSAGNVYGTTYTDNNEGGGTVFKIAASNNTLTTLALFDGSIDDGGESPPGAGLVIDSSGDLFGATDGGVNGEGADTIFKIAAGTSKLTTLLVFNGLPGGLFPEPRALPRPAESRLSAVCNLTKRAAINSRSSTDRCRRSLRL